MPLHYEKVRYLLKPLLIAPRKIEDGTIVETVTGIPQGGIIYHLLMN